MLAMAALIAAACSHDSDIVPENGGDVPIVETGEAIAFSADEQQEQTVTRATTPLSEKVTSFKVWGYKNMDANYATADTVMRSYTVRWTANSANTTTTNSYGWEYVYQQGIGEVEQSIKYWDYGAQAYRFFGVAGATETNKVRGRLNKQTNAYEVTYRADAEYEETIPYYSHLWFSTGNPADYPAQQFGKPVQLEFIKPLSKVRFCFIFENPDDAANTELTEKVFRPSNGNTIKLKGNVTVSYPLTGATNNKEQFATNADGEGMNAFTQDYYEKTQTGIINEGKENETTAVISPYLNANTTTLNKEYTVLPAPDGQGSYTMTLYVNGEPKTAVVPAEFMVWLPGYQYTYIFKIHVDGGVTIDNVQAAFTKWIEIPERDHPIYNW